jgi:hypothetical protein
MTCATARRLRDQAAAAEPAPAEPVRSFGECRTLPMFSDADAE